MPIAPVDDRRARTVGDSPDLGDEVLLAPYDRMVTRSMVWLDCLRLMGVYAANGHVSGPSDPIDVIPATRANMSKSKAQIDDFLSTTRIGLLGTLNEDGSPNVIPLWFEWDGEKMRMFSRANAAKVRRIQRDPRASVTVANGVGEPEDWVSVEGTAAVSHEGGQELAFKLAELYYEPAQAKKVREVWSGFDDWVVIELTPSFIRSM